jgi:uncharacterized membrane protein
MRLGATIRPSLEVMIKNKYKDWNDKKYICREDLDIFRKEYIQHVLETERGELSRLDKDVVKSLLKHEVVTKDINSEFSKELGLGDRLADRVASFGGSWKFIIFFGIIIAFWVSINAILLATRPFDPYPFILLNLVLSCVAAMQAPVIMMSQNRKEERDRLRGEHDYKVDLKAELEIRHLHEKLDHLVTHQWQRLLEVQEVQLELLQEMRNRKK